MQFKQIALASALAAIASTSFAAPAYLSGASASLPDVAAALGAMCPGGVKSYKAATSATSNSTRLENAMTFACASNFTGTSVDVVHLNVAGGSLTAVTQAVGTADTSFVDPNSASCVAYPDNANAFHSCGNLPVRNSEGGFSDTELSIARSYLSSKGVSLSGLNVQTASSNLLQTFGVAVSDDLYVLLYKAQYGKQIPTSCVNAATASTTEIVAAGYGAGGSVFCQPSVSRAEMASIMNGTATARNGGTLIFNGVTQRSRLVYCRRPVTSGTQQTAQNYFLTNPASASGLDIVGGNFEMTAQNAKIEVAQNGVTFAALAGSGTGNTIDCLGGRNQDNPTGTNGTITAANNFRIGVVSGERVAPTGYLAPTAATTGSWKFVRLNEVPLTEGTSTAKNVQTAKDGRYDLVVETRYNSIPSVTPATTTALMAAIAANIAGNNFPGLYKIDTSTTTVNGTAVTRSSNHNNNDSKAPLVR